jgi:hypothetical protein
LDSEFIVGRRAAFLPLLTFGIWPSLPVSIH